MRASSIRKTGTSMRELSKTEFDLVHGGAITPVKENPGGNEPMGEANGKAIQTFNENPAGHRPPGQN
jgi:hypothetical protein